jgi:hypothetical protein
MMYCCPLPATVAGIEVERGRLIDLNVFKQRTTGIHDFIS